MSDTHQDFDLCLAKRASSQFVSFVLNDEGGYAARHEFTLHVENPMMRETLQRLESYALHKEKAEDDFHIRFGQMLYGAALGGDVGACFAERLAAARSIDAGLRLRVRVAEGALELADLPWEFIHDGENFLATRWETPVSRLPLGIARRDQPPLKRPPRVLVVVANPQNLPSNRLFNTEREQEIILAALDKIQLQGALAVDYCEDGTLEAMRGRFTEQEYDILHFIGHGLFNQTQNRGELLLQDEHGNMQILTSKGFAKLLQTQPSLRLVVLSACQSARTASNSGYAEMSRHLLQQGIPTVLSMPYRVLDEAAILLGDRFYTGLAQNKPLDVALTEARLGLHMIEGKEGIGRVDFATPKLYLNDPNCVTVTQVEPEPEEIIQDTPVDWGTVPMMDKGFVGRRQAMRRIQRGFASGGQRAVVIYGREGIGKSCLATHIATQLSRGCRGVKAARMTPSIRPENILDELNVFLNRVGVDAFDEVVHAPKKWEFKIEALAQILVQVPLLLIFDSLEIKRQIAQDGAQQQRGEIADEALAEFFEQLVASVSQGTHFVFTARYDFDTVTGRLADEIAHLPLNELSFPLAVQCMNNHDILASLPVIASSADGEAPPSGTGVSLLAITKRELYRKLGGHPYTIDLFARRAAATTVTDALQEIAGTKKERIEETLLEHAFTQLPLRAQTILLRASLLDEALPVETLQWMMGDRSDAVPTIDAELNTLLNWGMLTCQQTWEGEAVYLMHPLVREFTQRQLAQSSEDETSVLLRIAPFWEVQGQHEGDICNWVRARKYYYRAGAYKEAWQIVAATYNYLVRQGYIELTIKLLQESIETLDGSDKAEAMGNLAAIYRTIDEPETALKYYAEAEGIMARSAQEDVAARDKLAALLHFSGIVHQELGNHDKAQAKYEQSLSINQELGNMSGIAKSLHNLGMIHQEKGHLAQAEECLEQSLALKLELEDKRGAAKSYSQLGSLYLKQGDLSSAWARYGTGLQISRELGDEETTAGFLHQLGMIYQEQENLDDAQSNYEQSLATFSALGARREMASVLHNLGMIHQKRGDLDEAQAKYEQSLAIETEQGNKEGIALSLGQLARIFEEQGSLRQAVDKYMQALTLFEQLGSQEVDKVQHQLARLRAEMGTEAFTEAVVEFDRDAEELAGTGELPLGQILGFVVYNMLMVMTESPQERQEWWETMEGLRFRAQARGDDVFATFLAAAQQVVQGTDPTRVSVELEEPYAEVWRQVVEELERED